MRKGILAAATLLLALQAPAMDLRVGCALGTRSVDDERLREAYGPGTVYFPYAALSFWKGAAVGAGLERVPRKATRPLQVAPSQKSRASRSCPYRQVDAPPPI